jgi:hypothetical protein
MIVSRFRSPEGGKVASLSPVATETLKLLSCIGCRKIFPHSRWEALLAHIPQVARSSGNFSIEMAQQLNREDNIYGKERQRIGESTIVLASDW